MNKNVRHNRLCVPAHVVWDCPSPPLESESVSDKMRRSKVKVKVKLSEQRPLTCNMSRRTQLLLLVSCHFLLVSCLPAEKHSRAHRRWDTRRRTSASTPAPTPAATAAASSLMCDGSSGDWIIKSYDTLDAKVGDQVVFKYGSSHNVSRLSIHP